MLISLCQALGPVEKLIKVLGQEDADLILADNFYKFTLESCTEMMPCGALELQAA